MLDKFASYLRKRLAITEEQANDDWYDTLDVYSIQFTINNSSDIETLISAGDTFSQDHILDIELINRKIISIFIVETNFQTSS